MTCKLIKAVRITLSEVPSSKETTATLDNLPTTTAAYEPSSDGTSTTLTPSSVGKKTTYSSIYDRATHTFISMYLQHQTLSLQEDDRSFSVFIFLYCFLYCSFRPF